MITILDPDCIVFERIWCIYEFYKAHEMKKTKKEFLFDIYTDTIDNHDSAVGITDGLIDDDYGNTNLKLKRELIFPIERITSIAVKVDITKAKATNVNDEIKIREIIDKSNVKSEDLNNLLHGIFVSSILERLLKESNSVDVNLYLNIIKQSHVTNINLNFIDCDKTDDTIFRQLTDSLPETLTRFKFYSEGSKISKESLTNIYSAPLYLPNLTEIKLAYNKMDDDGVDKLVSAFISSKNSKLESLDIGVNEITCVGIEKISTLLFPQLQNSLKVLILSKNKIYDDGAKYIADALNSYLKRLEILRLSNNYIGNKGAIDLAKAISDHERLEVVKMNANVMYDDGALEIAKCLSNNKSLKKFYLQDNVFTLNAILAIANAVKNNTRLKLLSVNNTIGKELNEIEFEWKKVNTDIEFFY
jgi:Ran GTPase-activating protein (RanGAP) involved in mRNA processing and transport